MFGGVAAYQSHTLTAVADGIHLALPQDDYTPHLLCQHTCLLLQVTVLRLVAKLGGREGGREGGRGRRYN